MALLVLDASLIPVLKYPMDFVYESRLKTNEFCMQNSKRVLELKRQDIACFGLRRLEMPSLAMGKMCVKVGSQDFMEDEMVKKLRCFVNKQL
jgi:hypothetical protein